MSCTDNSIPLTILLTIWSKSSAFFAAYIPLSDPVALAKATAQDLHYTIEKLYAAGKRGKLSQVKKRRLTQATD